MNRLTLVLLLASSFPLAARADEASHRAKAQEMMTLLHTKTMVQHISENLKKQLTDAAATIIGTDPSPEKKADAANFVKQADDMIDTQLSWTAMEPTFTDIYVKNFTEEQLDSIIAFYKTPAGLALLTTMPTVNDQVSQFGNSRLHDTLQPQLKQLYESFREKDGAPAAPHSSAAPSLGPAPQSPSAPK